MDNLIAPAFQFAQESRQHPGGLRLGIVKQHDPAPDLIDSAKDETKFLFGPHRLPVARPDVGAENQQSARARANRAGRGLKQNPET